MIRYVVFLCYSLISLSEQSVDLNLRQLQYVADHLTPTQCDKLAAALKENDVQVLPRNLSGQIAHEKPCLVTLADWSRGKGQNQTVDELAMRLHEIGRADVAQGLSKAVYDETTFQLHRFFLDDPFKKSAHEASLLVEDDDASEEEKAKSGRLVVASQYVTSGHRIFMFTVVASTLTLLFIVITISASYIPAFTAKLCPSCFLTTYAVMKDRLKERVNAWRKTRGLPPITQTLHKQAGDLTQEEKERLLHHLMSGLHGV